jgi:carboxyl-terminal processing protease
VNPTPIGPVKKRFALTTVIAIILVTALTSFILGTRANDIMAWAGSGQNRDLASDLDFSGVEEVYDKLREKYDGKLDPAALIEGAKKGLVEATGDPYTSYFSQEEAKAFMSDLEGSFSGIGAELDKREGQLLVVSTLDDSPARKSGLQANDQIVKVNDQDTTDWSIDEAVSQIRGEKGTTVKLTVVRSQEIKDFSIIRDAIVAPSVKWEITNDNVGYLRISRFAESSTTELATKAAREFKDKNVKGVVLDLRGNGGGYLKAAQDIASLWLDDKVIVEERGDGKSDKLRSGGNPILGGMPTVVLVDGGSASASEIVAGALHDNDAAQLVGVKTFGKGSVQELVDLPGGAALKVTIAKWFTPTGKNITEEGIEPEIKVELSNDDLANKRDPQKDRAFELLR